MNPSKVFEHKATVEEIRGNLVRIRMTVTEACGACSAKNICGNTSSKERTLEVPSQNNHYEPGEEVDLIIQQSKGYQAVLIGYAIPVFILILTLILMLNISKNETMAALVSIGSVAIYYLIIYLLKDKINKNFSFTLRKRGI